MERYNDNKSTSPGRNMLLSNSTIGVIGNTFLCNELGHDKSPLNIVCIDNDCEHRGLVCSMCLHLYHA